MYNSQDGCNEARADAVEAFGDMFAGVYPDWSNHTKTIQEYAYEVADEIRKGEK